MVGGGTQCKVQDVQAKIRSKSLKEKRCRKFPGQNGGNLSETSEIFRLTSLVVKMPDPGAQTFNKVHSFYGSQWALVVGIADDSSSTQCVCLSQYHYQHHHQYYQHAI